MTADSAVERRGVCSTVGATTAAGSGDVVGLVPGVPESPGGAAAADERSMSPVSRSVNAFDCVGGKLREAMAATDERAVAAAAWLVRVLDVAAEPDD